MTNIAIIDRTAARIARIRGDVPVIAAPGNAERVPAGVAETGKATARQGGLGPKQLEWCRNTWSVFATCERQALAAEEHRKQLMEAVRS